ncbi:hypothetical protein Q4520_14260 [Alteromonas sp. 1_MG-2023]|uniref:hypothetical protein n=1 Tax=Alteromonas sp. 1_MG-2023 TaxID=3062669 RepID=UPI0026E48DFC|nr:hypothetical protein [Alteromonas sp. 1_MG-2023]MDO6476593.1 hypothetical protein [Alteromonas sp. 1_MG-2023]
MNLQIAQLFSANATAAPVNPDAGALRSDTLQQLPAVTITRLPGPLIQLTGNALPQDGLVVKDPGLSTSQPQVSLARTSVSQMTLFELLPVKHSAVLTQADTQRLVTALAEGLTQTQQLSLVKNNPALSLGAIVEQASPKQLTLRLQLPGAPVIKLDLPATQHGATQAGDKLSLKITPSTDSRQSGWQITLTTQGKGSAQPAQSVTVPASAPVVKLALAKALVSEGLSIEGKLPGALKRSLHLSDGSSGSTGRETLLTLNVSMRGTQLSATGTQTRPLAMVNLPPALATSASNTLQALPPVPLKLADIANRKGLPVLHIQPPPDLAAPVASQQVSGATSNNIKDVLSAGPLNLPPEQLSRVSENIRKLSRQLLAETGSTSEALTKLVSILTKASPGTAAGTRDLMSALSAQITASLPVIKTAAGTDNIQHAVTVQTETGIPPQDTAQSIKQLLQTPALVTTPTNILNPPSQSGFVNALITLLQISFAGRAVRNQPDLAKALDKAESVIVRSTASAGGGSPPSKTAGDMAQIDSRTHLLDHVKSLLANHQQQKLQSAEARLQGQDTLYYVLPVAGDDQPPPELFLRVEERDAREEQAKSSAQRIWHLTMKLSAGGDGELLAKTKIDKDVIHINVYTSTDALLIKVMDTMPWLLKRLKGLGLEVEQHSCQRGKIPPSLKDTPYQLFETLV